MVNNTDIILRRLRALNLDSDEARLYLELLKEPATHLRLARSTGINRSKVYRLVERLEKRSLVGVRSDDRGTFIMAADPATLEVQLVAQEEKIKIQREAFQSVLPMLLNLKSKDTSGFIIHAYEGEEGFKQMLWHELKAEKENLIFGCGSLNDLITSQRWIEQHQARMVSAGYHIRELVNPGDKIKVFTVPQSLVHYRHRIIEKDVLVLQNQIATYNDTVSIYHWRRQQKVGVEIINRDYASMMRQMFEQYWRLAQSPTS